MILSFAYPLHTYSELDKPRVSIITSVFKGNDFIAGFLSDITRQTIFDQCELIIINANSPGDEEPIILQYLKKYQNIIYKKLDHDPGLYAVWNLGIDIARAEYITNANLDDRRNPESLEIHAKALDENLYVDLVYSDFYVTFNPNETFECNTHQYSIIPDEFSPSIMYKCITGPQPMWRKNVHEKYGYFDESFLSAGDFEMWNRAVSLGAKLKKISGHSGLYFLNPQGLSTDSTRSSIQEAELQRINEKYNSYWFAHYHYYCTACDERYFKNLLQLIGSIHKASFDSLGEIAVFDLGMTELQKEYLKTIEKVSVYSIDNRYTSLLQLVDVSNNGKKVPGWYAWKFVFLKQALEMFPYVLWVDAGTTILKPLDSLFKYIQQSGYFLCTMGDEKFYNQIAHPIEWGATKYVKDFFDLNTLEKKWVLQQEPLLSGTIGISRKALDYLLKPLNEYVNNIELFVDDGTCPNGFGTGRHDQTLLSIYAYLNGLTIHRQDYTQEYPIYLYVENKYEEIYITWNGSHVNDKTCLYNSRCDFHNYEQYVQCIRYK